MNDLLVVLLTFTTLGTIWSLWRGSDSYRQHLDDKCKKYWVIPTGVVAGGNCGLCGKWVNDVVVWEDWWWTICDECSEFKENNEQRRMSEEYSELPDDIMDKIQEVNPTFYYTLVGGKLLWVGIDFNDVLLRISLDCDEDGHAMKFIVVPKE